MSIRWDKVYFPYLHSHLISHLPFRWDEDGDKKFLLGGEELIGSSCLLINLFYFKK